MRDRWILLGLCIFLTSLWLPGFRWPISSDTSIYALLGRSVWTTGSYSLFGEAYAKHLPLHAIVSFPFTFVFGMQAGMKISSLLAGFGVIIAAYLFTRSLFGRVPALITAAFITVHHGFVLIAMLGSADLLFTFLFTLALWSLWQAKDDDRWYLATGLLAGLASLTRYNGVPLLVLLGLIVLLRRPAHLKSSHFWTGCLAGGSLFALWLARNAAVFHDPLHTSYTGELAAEAPNILGQFFANVLYYLQPQHNLLPVALALAVYGFARAEGRRGFIIAGLAAAWALTAIWWVQAMRFAFPGYVLLLGLAGFGLVELWKAYPRWRVPGGVALGLALLATHGAALCLYAFGSCNAWFDRTVGLLPPDMGISSEGLYAWADARDWLNDHAPFGAIVSVSDPINEAAWQHGVFRADLRVMEHERAFCPRYFVTQKIPPGAQVLYETSVHPLTRVSMQSCP